jgi:hypothetical protein
LSLFCIRALDSVRSRKVGVWLCASFFSEKP